MLEIDGEGKAESIKQIKNENCKKLKDPGTTEYPRQQTQIRRERRKKERI